jgi:hypothetical protein
MTHVTLRAGCAWFVITRVFQILVMMYMVVMLSSMSAVNHRPEFIILSAVCLAYIVGQLMFTLLLYHRMDLKLTHGITADMLPAAGATNGNASLVTFVDTAPVPLSMDRQLKNQPARTEQEHTEQVAVLDIAPVGTASLRDSGTRVS